MSIIINSIKSAKEANQELRVSELERLFINICIKNIYRKNKTLRYISHENVQSLLRKLDRKSHPIFFKLIRDFEFPIPTLVDKETKETVFKKEPNKEYYNPYEIYMEAKNSGLFFDFVVLHYDERKDAASRVSETTKKKDPIIFGIPKGYNTKSNQNILSSVRDIKDDADLIYITDWKDQYCDLTIEEFISTCQENGVNCSSLDYNNKFDIKKEIEVYFNNLIDKENNLKKDMLEVLNKHNLFKEDKEGFISKVTKLFK